MKLNIDYLLDNKNSHREESVIYLGRCGCFCSKYIKVLIPFLKDDNPRIRSGMIITLYQIDSSSIEVEKAVRECLHDKHLQVRKTALEYLKFLNNS